MGRNEHFAAGSGEHDVLYHLTDKARFKPSAKHVPHDNTFAIQQRDSPGLYLTQHPESWVNGHNYVRPFVAEVHVPKGLARDERWGGEKFVPAEHLDKVKVARVMPLDAHARERYGDHGWIEDHHGTTFDTGEEIPRRRTSASPLAGYRYDGPDVRDMPADMVRQHRTRARQMLQARLKGRG